MVQLLTSDLFVVGELAGVKESLHGGLAEAVSALVGTDLVVERSSRTPTGSFSECLFIPGIHGSGCRLRSTR